MNQILQEQLQVKDHAKNNIVSLLYIFITSIISFFLIYRVYYRFCFFYKQVCLTTNIYKTPYYINFPFQYYSVVEWWNCIKPK